jgi:hypothetical protein
MRVVVYILTHNSPSRLRECLSRMQDADADFFTCPVTVVDQSTVPAYADANAAICEEFAVQHVPNKNLGASGGRWYCAQLFHEADADGMFYFEDDIVWNNGAGTDPNRCAMKIPIKIGQPFFTATACLEKAQLGFLKLTFQEFWTDHVVDIGAPGTPIANYTVTHANWQMALVGDVFYSNWPMLITKETSQLLFLDAPETEGVYRQRAHELRTAGKFRAGILAAEPLYHTGQDADRPDDVDLRQPD